MLQRFITLDNIGLFRNGITKPFDLARATLIYAENGRGKTTVCAVLRSCAENQPGAVAVRQTADGTDPPKVAFRLDTGGANVTLEKGAWSVAVPQFVVFDSEFVERNVYAGQDVRPSHKQQLLDFALGDSAVKLKAQTEELATAQIAATRERTAQENKLLGYRGRVPLGVFLDLPKVDDAEAKIATLEARIRRAASVKENTDRKELSGLASPAVDLMALEKLLHTEIEGVQAAAEHTVRQHLATHGQQDFERWVADGQRFLEDDASCPFCAQPLVGIALISAYKTYFNAQYNELKVQAADAKAAVAASLSPQVGESMAQTHATNDERYALWREHIAAVAPMLNVAQLKKDIAAAAFCIGPLLDRKVGAPLEVIGSKEEIEEAQAALDAVIQHVAKYNECVGLVNKQIAEFKQNLRAEDATALQAQVTGMRLQKVRHSQEVDAIVTAYRAADKNRATVEAQKEKARAQLNTLMTQTLSDYGVNINVWLKKFGASFEVVQMKQVYARSGAASTDYGLLVRKKVVKPGPKSDTELSFSIALSEGDKRTLAFAFFLARLFSRADRASLVAVLDDPFASLDRHRRAQTQAAILRAVRECKQVVVLAHDAFFLRDVRDDVVRKGLGPPCVLEIKHATHGYSCIEHVDLSTVCISPYMRNYRRVMDFVDATGHVDARTAAEALRPLMEGHLHRRFPGMLNGEQTLGEVIGSIKNAPKTSPLAKIQDQVPVLADFNDFAGRYHHDTNPNAGEEVVDEGEVRMYGAQVVALIQTGRI